MAVKPGYLLFAGGGGIVAYCGITGKSPTGALRALVGGASPSTAAADPSLAIANYGYSGGAAAGAGGQGGAAIVAKAMTYVGHKYVFGGPSNPNGGWDCSSFVSYILGTFSYGIPGGSWAKETNNGSSHGPVASQYLAWSGATTKSKSAVSPGDLLVWPTHIGFAVDANHMISAFTTAQGTLVTGWDGPTGEPGPLVRSVNAAQTTAGAGGTATATGSEASFIQAVLSDLGAPNTAANVSSLTNWIKQEDGSWGNSGSSPTYNNPLNVGPWHKYSDMTAGAAGTAQTIQNGFYPNIVMHLKAGTGLLTGCAADLAKWGTGGSGY
jgi:NlpC/P60 family